MTQKKILPVARFARLARVGSLITTVTVVSLLTTACAYQQPNGYNRDGYGGGYAQTQPQPGYGGGYGQQQQPAQAGVEYGVVANIEAMPRTYQRGSTSGMGAILGAVVGGVIGNQFGGGMGRAAMTAAGALGGAAAGNAIEGQSTPRGEAGGLYRLVINEDRGGQRVFDVPDPGDLRPGDRVRMANGQISRS